MKRINALVGPLLQEFFVKRLLTHRNVSPQTLSSYSDAFRLLLQFVATKMHIEPVALNVTELKSRSHYGVSRKPRKGAEQYGTISQRQVGRHSL